MTPAQRREIHDAMVRFADGDRGAFRDVFDALWPVLSGFASRALTRPHDAEDVAQRALLKVFGQIADLDRDRDGVAWAITIAAYEVMTIRKQRQRRREEAGDLLAAVVDGAPRPDEQVAAEELRGAVRDVVGELGERDREAIADVLDEVAPVPGETARKRRFRAVERLRAVWRKAHG